MGTELKFFAGWHFSGSWSRFVFSHVYGFDDWFLVEIHFGQFDHLLQTNQDFGCAIRQNSSKRYFKECR